MTTELAGWVDQMNDTLQDLRDRQAEAAQAIDPGKAGTPETAARPSADPPPASPDSPRLP